MEQIREQIERQRGHKALHISIYLGIAIALAAMFVYLFWSFYPYEPFTSKYEEFPILNENKTLKAGDTIVFLSETCRNYVGEVEIHRALANDVLIPFTNYTFYQEEKGCKSFENHGTQVPQNAPDGVYHLEITSIVKVNPIRTVSTKFRTEDFVVRNPALEISPEVLESILEEHDL